MSALWTLLKGCGVANTIYTYHLPYPPSTNRLWRITGKRMYRSKKYLEWMGECALALELENRPNIDYRFNIEIVVGRPDRRRRDLDNLSKPILDCLQHCRIVKDDCLNQRMTLMWTNEFEGAKVTIWRAEAH